MCGGKGQQTSSSTTGLPQQAQDAYYRTMDRAEGVADTPYNPYGGPRVAGFNPDQQDAFQSVRNTQGIGQPWLNQASQYATAGADPITGAQINQYMNPYIDSVVNATQDDFNVQNQRELQTVNTNAAKVGALTGDRSQVANALAQESQRRTQDPVIANLRASGYDSSLSAAQADRAAAANAASQYGALAGQQQQMTAADQERLLATGSLQQANQQNQYDVDFQEHLRQQAYPFETTQWLAGILGGLLPGFGSTTTQETPGKSLWSDILGAGATVAGGWLSSDERIKEDVAPVGELFDGTPIYRYRYAGRPETQIGVLAQDIEQTNPEAVAEIDGLKHVNYETVTEPSAQAVSMAQDMGQGIGEGPEQDLGTPPLPGPEGLAPEANTADPEFARLTSNLGHAVDSLKDRQRVARARGGIAPAPVNPAQTAPSYVPQSQMTAGQMAASPIAQPAQGGGSSAFGAGAAALGKGLGAWSDRRAKTGQGVADHNWADVTSVRPAFAWGGTITPSQELATGRPMHSGFLTGDQASTQASPPVSTAGFNDAQIAGGFAPAPVRPAEITTGALPEGGIPPNKPPRVVPDAPLPPQAQPYAAPEPEQLPWQTETQPATDAESEAEKAWYEYGGSPDIGRALMLAGAATMASESPYAGTNIGRGILTGLKGYYGNEAARRQAEMEQEKLDLERRIAEARIQKAEQGSAPQLQERFNEETGQPEKVYWDSNAGDWVVAGGSKQDAAGSLTKGQEAVDKAFAKTYAEEIAGGKLADNYKNLRQLEDVLADVEAVAKGESDANLSGPVLGQVPDRLGRYTNPQAVDTRERVEEVIQRNLREVLGAQFTEKEGERLIARAYNPGLEESVNAYRLRNLIGQIKSALQAKGDAAQYYEENGTLKGFKGKVNYTMNDFREALDAPKEEDLSDEGAPPEGGGENTPPEGAPEGARQAPDGNWYIDDPDRPGKHLMVE